MKSPVTDSITQQRARAATYRALRDGVIVKGERCAKCGVGWTECHHPNYSRPLSVAWLCGSCHAKLHRKQHKALWVKAMLNGGIVGVPCKCARCGWKWKTKSPWTPVHCPHCQKTTWNGVVPPTSMNGRVGRPLGPLARCCWCGAEYTTSAMRSHMANCKKRPDHTPKKRRAA